jgi:DNA-binding transcriptional LysR family regulator
LPVASARDWLDHTFDRKHLPRPQVQVESTMLLMLPTLIEQTGLLSFISRHHLVGRPEKSGLKEVSIKEATMHRRLVVTYRDNSYMSPAATRLIALFEGIPDQA